MKTSILACFSLLLLSVPASACVITNLGEDYTAVTQRCPADITQFFNRAFQCAYWGGEEPHDEERSKQEIESGLKAGRCDALACDGTQLLATYKDKPLYPKIHTAWSHFVERVYDKTPEAVCRNEKHASHSSSQ